MGDAEAVKIGGEAQARVIRARRLLPLFGKEEGEAVDRSGEEYGRCWLFSPWR
jgi:hypothetical protein